MFELSFLQIINYEILGLVILILTINIYLTIKKELTFLDSIPVSIWMIHYIIHYTAIILINYEFILIDNSESIIIQWNNILHLHGLIVIISNQINFILKSKLRKDYIKNKLILHLKESLQEEKLWNK